MAARANGGAIAVPFIGKTRICVSTNNIEARGYVSLGLPEFEDMGFFLHAVRPGDLFVDVGAFVGGYTLLAAGACGGRVVAIEPNPVNRRDLERNISLNRLESRVSIRPVALGGHAGTVAMTTAGGSVAHVIADDSRSPSVDVPLETLDRVLDGAEPDFIKVDVEGFEWHVLSGGKRTLSSPRVLAVLLELNESGAAYGIADQSVHEVMLTYGFRSYRYEPWTRTLASLDGQVNDHSGNTLYIRDLPAVEERVRTAPVRRVHGCRL
jgi:FkbM family methyltransferase